MILSSYLKKRKTSKEIASLKVLYLYLSNNRTNLAIQNFKKEFKAKDVLENFKTKLNNEYSTFQDGRYSEEYCSIYEKMDSMNTFEDGLQLAKSIKELEIKIRKEVPHYNGIYFNTLFFTSLEFFDFMLVGLLVYFGWVLIK